MNPFLNILNTYFDKIYVLTIPSAKERQDEFSKSMHGLNFQFFYGIEKQTLDQENLEQSGMYDDELAKEKQRYEKSMTMGQIACAIGHRHIYEDIVANNIRNALIFEDDAFPLRENIQHIPQIWETLPEDWNILFLDYDKNEKKVPLKQTVYHVQHFLGFLKWDHTVIKNLFPRDVNKFWKTAGFHDFTDAYAINYEAAKKLVALQTPLSFVADNLLANAVTKEHLKGYICVPKLFAQRSTGQFKSIETMIDEPAKQYSQKSNSRRQSRS